MDATGRMLELWTKVFNCPIGENDNFFADLNGDSLIALQLIEVISSEYDMDFSVELLFLNPTAARMTEAVASAVRTGAAAGSPPDE